MGWDKALAATKALVCLLVFVAITVGAVAAGVTLGVLALVLLVEGGYSQGSAQVVSMLVAVTTCLGLSLGCRQLGERLRSYLLPPPGNA